MAVQYNPAIVTDGLVLCLDAANRKSYPGTGTGWTDITGKNSPISLINGPTFNSSGIEYISFEGANDYAQGNISDNFNFGTGNFTVDVWFYPTTIGGLTVDLRTGGGGAGLGYSDYFTGAGKYYLYWGANRYGPSNFTIVTGRWYNIVSTRNGSTLTVYNNGVADGTSSDSSSLTENGLYLGRNVNTADTGYLNGRIACVKIYKGKALTADEVRQNFNALRGRFGI